MIVNWIGGLCKYLFTTLCAGILASAAIPALAQISVHEPIMRKSLLQILAKEMGKKNEPI